jgi:cell division protein FtsQ
MLVTGSVKKDEYEKLAELVEKIDKDDFSKKYFIGISKDKNGDYNLLTSEGNYKVELGDLDNIDLKVKGFKAFVEKYLVYQDPQKYNMISIKYQNQIVTTLNPYFKENDSILKVGSQELAKVPPPTPVKKTEAKLKIAEVKKTTKKPGSTSSKPKESQKPKTTTKPKETKKTPEKKSTVTKPKTKAKVKIE